MSSVVNHVDVDPVWRPIRAAPYSGHAWFKWSSVVARGSFPKLTGRELTPLKVRAERK